LYFPFQKKVQLIYNGLSMNILSIETSCDETACAVVENGTKCLASTIATSKELHESTGGIVPEIAARKQLEFIVPVIDKTLKDYCAAAGKTRQEAIESIDSIAVTAGPGLIGSLLIGVEAAKALAVAWNKPLIPVNHLVGHIYANFLTENTEETLPIQFPCVVLIVSGGHTDLVLMKGHGDFEFIGSTLDDAAGEAFDKTARLLGLSKYLGGAELSKLAETAVQPQPSFLPRPMLDKDNYDFSFSGLKTSVKRIIESGIYSTEHVAYEFEEAVVDVLVTKTIKATKEYGAKTILLGGGVSANKKLRNRMQAAGESIGVYVRIPSLKLCTDNAIYIASAAYFINTPKKIEEVTADPSLTIMSNFGNNGN